MPPLLVFVLILSVLLGVCQCAWWDQVSATDPFQVRSSTYLNNKVKEDSLPAMLNLVHVELLQMSEYIDNIAQIRLKELSNSSAYSEWLVFQFQIPLYDTKYGLVIYFGYNDDELDQDAAATQLFRQFMSEEDSFRNERLKIIPRLIHANWWAKRIIGQKPVIIGNRKVDMQYFKGDNYFEMDCNLQRSSVATNLLKSHGHKIAADIAVVLQGTTAAQLPERILGAVQLQYVDFKKAIPLNL